MSNDNSSSNMNVTAETMMGGSTRVQFSKGQSGNTDNHAAAMLKRNVSTLDARDTFVSVATSHGNAANASGTITSAVTKSGMMRSGIAISEGDLINVQGIPMTIKDAVGMGIAVRNANGTFSLGKA